jgi:uncharacterized protein (TIGR00369 family)
MSERQRTALFNCRFRGEEPEYGSTAEGAILKRDDHISAVPMDELRKFMTEAIPYWNTLGLELIEVAPGHAVFQAEVRPGLLQNNMVHGGVLASIADSACAVAAIATVFPESYATTINLQVAYLKPVKSGRFKATGKCIKAGRSIFFCEAVVVDEQDVVVCTANSQLIAQKR